MSEFDYLFKIIVVGDGGVGKTAIAVRFSEGVFQDDYKMTIGVDFSIKTMNLPVDGEARRVKLQIWDTGGQERFSYTRPLYYKGAVGGLVVFDLTNRRSFENLGRWFDEITHNCVSLPLILVGNKADLPTRKIVHAEAEAIANTRAIGYFETSAKSGQSINAVFEKLAETIVLMEERQIISEEHDIDAKRHKISIEQYLALAEQAYEEINKLNYQAALKLLKQAFYYAKAIEYHEGKKWIEDQTQLILQILNQQKARATQEVSIYMYCAFCNRQYRVSRIGNVRCPECSNYLARQA
ncbi:MAG: GTP-binding protein [Candidatus Helarchaeota archaeon]|nr:GTP-binding protein [Candidatus Helarchaeota archaeon]